jgi:hypothetical protein
MTVLGCEDHTQNKTTTTTERQLSSQKRDRHGEDDEDKAKWQKTNPLTGEHGSI